MNFSSYVFKTSKYLDDTAFIEKDREISFPKLYNLMQKVSNQLIDNKIHKQKIVLIADNSEFFIESYFGIIYSGNVCVPVNPTMGEKNIEYIIDKCNVPIVFIQKKYSHIKEKILTYIKDKNLKDLNVKMPIIINEDFMFEDRGYLNIDAKGKNDDLAVILFTSGSTADPKGVMLTHKNLISNTESIIEYLKLSKNDRMEVVLPFYYCYGASLLHTHLKVGASLVINNKFMFPQSVLEDINKYNCTGFAGVPSNFQILLRKTNMSKMKFPSLRYVTQAGGSLQDVFIKELIETLPNAEVYIMYGQTEATARLSYLPPELVNKKMGSIGKGIKGVTLEVIDERGNKIKPGQTGQVIAYGDNIMKGYFQDEEATSEVIKNRKLYTGDLATIDEDGYIYLVAREKNMIKSAGNRISSIEIENVIAEIDKVIEVSVIGVFDEILGEAVKAFIVIKEQVDEEFVRDYCKERLPSYKVPKYIEFIKELPKNSSGKVLIRELNKKI